MAPNYDKRVRRADAFGAFLIRTRILDSMPPIDVIIALAGYAIGALGGVLVFIEFFQTPSYITYQSDWDDWNVDIAPSDVNEYTRAGRVGAILIALAFALEFVATLL